MITLRKVTEENLREILELHVGAGQRGFVAPNDMSLMEACIALTHRGQAFPFGIYEGDTAVGFCQIGFGADDGWTDAPRVAEGSYNIWRFMIGEQYQGRGYGRQAMAEILRFIRTCPCGKSELCWLSYEPENARARALYASFGFRETGERDGNEVIAVLPLRRPEAQVRYAEDKDRDFWFSLDRHLPEDAFERKVRDGQGLVMEVAGEPAGILRWSLFWDTIPFCNLLYLKEGFRRRGYGRQLMDTWERKMAEAGYALVLTSTQSDEEAQHFYRALGYRDCGGFLLPFPGFEQSLEVILGKTVTQKSRTNR